MGKQARRNGALHRNNEGRYLECWAEFSCPFGDHYSLEEVAEQEGKLGQSERQVHKLSEDLFQVAGEKRSRYYRANGQPVTGNELKRAKYWLAKREAREARAVEALRRDFASTG